MASKRCIFLARNSIENIIAKALAIALEHEHANECEGSPVKGTSKPKFAHACAKSVLKFTSKIVGRAGEEPVVRSFANQEIPPRNSPTGVSPSPVIYNQNGGVIKRPVLRIQSYWCRRTMNSPTAVSAKLMVGI